MQNNIFSFLLAIFSMIGLGVSNFLYKKSTLSIGPVNTTFFYYLFSIVIASVTWIFLREKSVIQKTDLIWPLLIAIFLFSSVLAFNFAVKYLNVSIAATIRSLSFTVTIVLAVCLLKEQLHLKDYIALAFAVIAIVLFGIDVTPKN